MLNLKKTAVAVLALSSSVVFAGTMGPVCAPGNVTVPCERTAWDFGAQALYLEPSLGGNSYVGTVYTNNNYAYQNLNRWAWGFKLEGSYHFNTGNDINLNWYHLNKSRTYTPVAGFYDPNGYQFATGTSINVKPQWNAVNLEMGQHVDFSQNSSARLHAGVAYVNLQSTGSISSTGAGTSTTYTAASNSIKYNGFGPRVGADLGYNWGNGFAVYGNSAVALFAGSNKFNASVTRGATPTTVTESGSTTSVVPELEAKLGATYTYAMAQGDLSLDAGWMWVNYFGANQIGAFGLGTYTADVAFQGPFVGLKWVGNVA